jgi:purine nucleoside permease
MQEEVKYHGVPVFMDGREWIVPALGVKQFKEHHKALTADMGELTAENFINKLDQTLPIIAAALRRNYPDITIDKLEEMVDMATFPILLKAIAAASGMRVAAPGE